MKHIISILSVLLLTPFAALPSDATNMTELAIGSRIMPSTGMVTIGTNSLAGLAQKIRPDFLFGSFAKGLESTQADDQVLKDFFRRNFNIMTIGVYMSRTQPKQGSYNLDGVDELVRYAVENNETIYLHPLIGGALYTPKWINEGHFSSEELEKIMRDRITTVLSRYHGKVKYVDVVNEALAEFGYKPDGQFDWRVKDSQGEHVWMKTMGLHQGKKYVFPKYLVEAFRIAREVGGNDTKLILNEYANDMTNSKRGHAFLKLVQALREEGIPVDGAGMQVHLMITNGALIGCQMPFDLNTFDAMLREYEKERIDVHITEFDIYLPANPTPLDFQLQGKYYAEVLRHAFASPAVKTFKTWGFTDKYSWKRDGPNGYPLMLDTNFQPKQAYLMSLELLKTLSKSPSTQTNNM